MTATYSATVQHASLSFTGTGGNDHQAVTQAMNALKAIWNIDINNAIITVKLGDQIQYVTTAGRYEVATN